MAVLLYCTIRIPDTVSLQNWNFPTQLSEIMYLGVTNCIFKSGTLYCQAITSVKIYLTNIIEEEREADLSLDVQKNSRICHQYQHRWSYQRLYQESNLSQPQYIVHVGSWASLKASRNCDFENSWNYNIAVLATKTARKHQWKSFITLVKGFIVTIEINWAHASFSFLLDENGCDCTSWR